MEEEVFQFTAQHFGVATERLSVRTRPWPDLCEDEQQAEAFPWRFSQRFGVPFPKLNNRQSAAYLALCVASFLRTSVIGMTTGWLCGLWLGTGQKGAGAKDGLVDHLFPRLTLGDLIAAATLAARHPEPSGTPPRSAE